MSREKLAAVLEELDRLYPDGRRNGLYYEQPPELPTEAQLKRFDDVLLESRRAAAKPKVAEVKKGVAKPRTRAAA